MVGLLDIAPIPEMVVVGDQSVPVNGVSVEGIAYLLQHFPQFAQLQNLMGGENKDDLIPMLFSMGPNVIASIIAAGCVGSGYNEETDQSVSFAERFAPLVRKAASLDVQTQADLLDAVLRKTLTKGLDPFVERLNSIKATLSPQVTLASKIKEAVVKKKSSPKPSNPSLDGQGIQPQTSGA